jgi:hypothetical protein
MNPLCPNCRATKVSAFHAHCAQCAMLVLASADAHPRAVQHLARCAELLKMDVAGNFRPTWTGEMNRHPLHVTTRWMLWYLARHTKVAGCSVTLSFPEIAHACGRPNHSTVVDGVQKCMGLLHAGSERVEPLRRVLSRLATTAA